MLTWIRGTIGRLRKADKKDFNPYNVKVKYRLVRN
jgi:hypothetical protein